MRSSPRRSGARPPVGIKLRWDAIKGMSPELLGRDGVCSNYFYEGC